LFDLEIQRMEMNSAWTEKHHAESQREMPYWRSSRVGGWRRVVPSAGAPRVKTAWSMGSAAWELWCHRLFLYSRDFKGVFQSKMVQETG